MSLPDVNELKEWIGKTGLLRVDETLLVPVKINDARIRFGHVDYRVVPLDTNGEGWTWIESGRFIPDDEPDKPGDTE